MVTKEDEQTTFDVKYIGNTPVDSAANAIAEAVKTILVMVSCYSNVFIQFAENS